MGKNGIQTTSKDGGASLPAWLLRQQVLHGSTAEGLYEDPAERHDAAAAAADGAEKDLTPLD